MFHAFGIFRLYIFERDELLLIRILDRGVGCDGIAVEVDDPESELDDGAEVDGLAGVAVWFDYVLQSGLGNGIEFAAGCLDLF